MIRLGSVVGRNSSGYYACEVTDEDGEVVAYGVFTAEGKCVRTCWDRDEAEALLTKLESTGASAAAHP